MPEQDPSRFEALKQGAKEKLAIGLVALAGLGSLATAEQANAEPVNTANVPEANASDQLQDCVDAALDDPLAIHTHVSSLGAKHNQIVGTWMRFKKTSAACPPLVSRETPVTFVKMQRPNNHSKLIKSQKKELVRGSDPFDPNAGLLGEAYFGKSLHDKGGNRIRYRCTPGKDITRMWVTIILRAASTEDGQILGKRSLTQPVKLPRKPRRLLRDHELPGPC